MSQQVLEGDWEEILQHTDELSGKRVRLTIIDNNTTSQPNEAMISAMREVAVIQRGMRLTTSEGSDTLLREAREGKMYDLDSGY